MIKDNVVEMMVPVEIVEVLVVGGHHMFQIKVALAMEAITIEDQEAMDSRTTAGVARSG